jgi:hypothetical protein
MPHASIPTISYELSMQRRYEAVRATIEHFKKPVPKSQNQHSMYGTNSSDDGPPQDEANVLNKT